MKLPPSSCGLLCALALLGCTQVHSAPDLPAAQFDEASAQGVCCWQQTGEPRQPAFRLDLSHPSCLPQERRVRRHSCDEVCCVTPGGVMLVTMVGLCDARGGWPGECHDPSPVCCSSGGDLNQVQVQACISPDQVVDSLECDLICCRQAGVAGWARAGRCAPSGVWLEPLLCLQDMATGMQ